MNPVKEEAEKGRDRLVATQSRSRRYSNDYLRTQQQKITRKRMTRENRRIRVEKEGEVKDIKEKGKTTNKEKEGRRSGI